MNLSPFLEYGAYGVAAIVVIALIVLLRDNTKERREMRSELQGVITNFSLVIQNHMEHSRQADIERTAAQVKNTAAMERLVERMGDVCEAVRERK